MGAGAKSTRARLVAIGRWIRGFAKNSGDTHVSLVLSLFSIMVSALVLIVAVLTIFVWSEGRRAADQTGHALSREVTATVAEHVEALFSPASILADLSSSLPGVAHPPTLLVHPAGWFIMRALDNYPDLYSAYMGYADGCFYQIIAVGQVGHGDDLSGPVMGAADSERITGTGAGILAAHGAPPGTRFLHRAVLPGATGRRMEIWTFLDKERLLIGSRIDADTSFDPRGRPWYRAALTRRGTIMTDMYRFNSLGLPGLTLAHPFDGDVPGVFGVDLTLDAIAVFLTEQSLTPNGRLMVAMADGEVIAYRGPMGLRTGMERAFGRPLTLSGLNDSAMVSAAVADGADQDVRITVSNVTGERLLVRRVLVPMSGDRDLVVAMAAPLSDYTGPVDALIGRILLVAGALALLSLPFLFLLAERMSATLRLLGEEAERIRDLDLSGTVRVRTGVREVIKLAEAQRMMKDSLRAFGLYVPKDLVRQILIAGGSAEPGGQRRELSILFTDIAGFTTLSEITPPEVLMVRTSRYFEEVTAAISARGGVIDKFIGDAVMAIWNAPTPVEGHTVLACLAALDARDRVSAFNAGLRARGDPEFRTRFGLHVGEAVVGNVGSSDRMNYSAVGAAVNMASRLEGLNKIYGTDILVSEAVVRCGQGRFVFREVDRVQPKGTNTPILVYQLLGINPKGGAGMGSEPVSATVVDHARRWNAAQSLLRRVHDIPAAAAAFAKLAEDAPDDPLAAHFRDLCQTLATDPVAAAQWDNLRVMEQK